MSIIDAIRTFHHDLTEFRRDLHAHPELGLEEFRTAAKVADALESWGIETHRGIGRTGVVGVLHGRPGNRVVGLRADMDALPMAEANDVPWRSTMAGRMHACGHDGHTTMLLGAARYLAQTRDFDGTVVFIFQPGEEGCGGALAMLEDGLFTRFPCDEIYGMHNRPGMPIGQFAICDGPAMAGGAFFDIKVSGKGSHGAHPDAGIDPVIAACQIATALQTVISRNLSPKDAGVISITRVSGGDAYNIVPQTATLAGTARFFDHGVGARMQQRMREIAEGVGGGLGCTVEVDWRLIFAPTINAAGPTDRVVAAATAIAGADAISRGYPSSMGSEDFSFMMEKVPGAYLLVGNGPGASVHNPSYMFDDEAIPHGAAIYAAIVMQG